jgi:DNA-binding Lrp family transcriptional regulator
VKVGNVPWPELADALAQLPYVESVLAVSGDIDFVLTVSAPDHEQLSEVIMRQIHDVPGVESTRSHIVLESRDGTAPGATRDDWHE